MVPFINVKKDQNEKFFFEKETLGQVFFYEFCEISKKFQNNC